MGKRILKILLHVTCMVATAILCSSYCVYAEEYETDCGTFTYSELSDGTLKITGYQNTGIVPAVITIPSAINSKTVTVIGDSVFWNKAAREKIVIPNTVTTIGNKVFGYTRSEVIEIPDSVTSIGESAFYGSDVVSVTIPKGVKKIKTETFSYCKKLEEVKLHNEIEVIGVKAFSHCTALRTINIPTSISYIDTWTFNKCTSLTSITIPSNIKALYYGAFQDCTSLSQINIENHKVNLLNGGREFDNTAWYNNQPDGVVYLDNALYGYKGDMPTNTKIEVREGTTYIVNYAFEECKNLVEITIPNTVTRINGYAFYKCKGLKEIVIPDSVSVIENSVFRECTSLTKVTLPSNLDIISDSLFMGCTLLKEFNIPETVTRINGSAFYKCHSIESIYISENVTNIQGSALTSIGGAKVVISPDNQYYTAEDDIVYNKEKTKIIACLSTLEKIVIPSTVTEISNGAFGYNSTTKRIIIPNSVTKIGNGAFSNCTALESIIIPDSVIEYGSNMFLNSTAIKRIKLPSSIRIIGDLDFAGCESLKYVKLPDELNEISDSAFMECKSLKSVKIPEGTKRIEIDAFGDCPGIETLIIPDSVTSIGSHILNGSNSNAIIYCSENSSARSYATSNSYLYDDIEKAIFVDCVIEVDVSDITKTSAKLSWDKVEDIDGYVIYRYDEASKSYKEIAKTVNTTYEIKNLESGKEYLYAVNAYKLYSGETVVGDSKVEIRFSTKEDGKNENKEPAEKEPEKIKNPENVSKLSFKAKENSITLNWKKQSGVKGYIVYKYDSKTKSWKQIKKLASNKNSYSIKKLKAGTTYKYAVKAYKVVNGKNVVSTKYKSIKTTTTPTKVKLTIEKKKLSAKLKWKKIKGASGYQVYRKVGKNGKWKKIKDVKKVTYTMKNLGKNKTYYFKVRAYKKLNGKLTPIYSDWSKVKNIKIKK